MAVLGKVLILRERRIDILQPHLGSMTLLPTAHMA